MKLSSRLLTVTTFIEDFDVLIDIGSDHGQLPIFLKSKYKNKTIIATEGIKDPFLNLKNSINSSELEIECIFTDGLKDLPKADLITICGMGGKLISKILLDTDYLLKFNPTLILEPQSNYYDVRKTLNDLNYEVIKEQYIEESEKYYPIIKAIKGHKQNLSDLELKYGKYSLENKDEVLFKLLLKKYNLFKTIKGQEEKEEEIQKLLKEYFNYNSLI